MVRKQPKHKWRERKEHFEELERRRQIEKIYSAHLRERAICKDIFTEIGELHWAPEQIDEMKKEKREPIKINMIKSSIPSSAIRATGDADAL